MTDRRTDWRRVALAWAARECGALEALATAAGTPAGLAAATGIDREAAERLVAALEAEGFLAPVGDAYEPTDRLLGFLTKTDLRSVGRLPAELDAFERWVGLPETLSGAAPPEPAAALRNELGREAAVDEARLRSEVTAAVHAAPDGDSAVVVGDGPGRRAVEFAARGWTATLLDAPDRIEAVEPLVAGEDIALRAGPLDDIPSCDLVVGAGVLRRLDAADARSVLEAAGAAADAAVFLDYFGGETPGAELADLECLAAGRGGVHEWPAVRSWLEAAFGDASLESVPVGPLSAAVGRAID